MSDDMMHTMPFHMVVIWAGVVILGGAVLVLVYALTRPASAAGMPLSELNAARRRLLSETTDEDANVDFTGAPAVDTIFILPDISNYTRFMTGTQFSFTHAQHIIFSLINAMIRVATDRVELSKLEGDAALFFIDAGKYTDVEIGNAVMDIFSAFFRERQRLKASNICLCHACRHIDTLDLKIFVHRGAAARFKFRGSVDLFGTDVIVLHRIMKNNVNSHRYVMVTEAANGSVAIPILSVNGAIEQDIPHIGCLRASVMKIDDQTAEQLAGMADGSNCEPTSVLRDTFQKLRSNAEALSPRRRRARPGRDSP